MNLYMYYEMKSKKDGKIFQNSCKVDSAKTAESLIERWNDPAATAGYKLYEYRLISVEYEK